MKRLEGWLEDDLEAALSVLRSVTELPARKFFETKFALGEPRTTHFTGYFETVLFASLNQSEIYHVPLYAMPCSTGPLPSRAEIAANGIDAEILAWLANPLDAFLLQVQGSGRLRLQDGRELGIGYAGKNNHPYRSIGAELVTRGITSADQMSLDIIRGYCAANPNEVQTLLNTNPSYVFFELRDVASGPIGAMGVPVTPFRSIAVDPDYIPLGTPVWIETEIEGVPHRRLMIAQDIGSAIKGPARADIFCGTGDEAGQIAGRLNTSGKMIPLLPATGYGK